MELFMSMTGTRMVHIPYKGSAPAIIDLLSGQVTTMIATMLTGLPHVRTGRLRALGITGLKRIAAAQDLPTVAEAGVPGYEAVQWYGLLAPAQTPREIVMRLNREMVSILQSSDVKERFASDGGDAVPTTSEDFARYIKSEIEKWARVAKTAGITAE
jgi:tripartite-type tricarboxylate transporter receptor subunit TctC